MQGSRLFSDVGGATFFSQTVQSMFLIRTEFSAVSVYNDNICQWSRISIGPDRTLDKSMNFVMNEINEDGCVLK